LFSNRFPGQSSRRLHRYLRHPLTPTPSQEGGRGLNTLRATMNASVFSRFMASNGASMASPRTAIASQIATYDSLQKLATSTLAVKTSQYFSLTTTAASSTDSMTTFSRHTRYLSTTATAADSSSGRTSSGAEDESSQNNSNNSKKKKDASDMFFDNLGKIFLLVISGVIASLVKSSAGTRNRNKLRDHLEDIAVLDPAEIEEMRIANSALTPEVFRTILQQVHDRFPNGNCSYHEFVVCVRKAMAQIHGEAFTIELGHLLDRLMVEVLKDHSTEDGDGSPDDTTMPVSLFLTALTLTLYSDVRDRIRILYEILQMEQQQEQQQYQSSSLSSGVTISQLRSLVGYLQETCQLPPDTQIVPTDTKYPAQQWRRGTPEDLVPWEGTDKDIIDLFTFATVLRSKSVCAWGECYQRRKFEEEDV